MLEIVKNVNVGSFELKKILRQLAEEYPFLSIENFAKSVGGRDIPLIKLGRSKEYVLFTASFHGSEGITTNILLRFLEELCYSIKEDKELAGFNIRKIMMGRGIIFVPLVNPDGVEISMHGAESGGMFYDSIKRISKGDTTNWNANARGVDINHNFNADWENLRKLEWEEGIYGPAMTRYGGHRCESEPETLALVNLCRTYVIRHAIALHSQGEVIYWNYKDKNPPRAKKMAEIMATSSGYALDEPEGLAVGGGFKDWFISEFNRPAFTVELGKGTNSLPIENAGEIYSAVREMFILTIAM